MDGVDRAYSLPFALVGLLVILLVINSESRFGLQLRSR